MYNIYRSKNCFARCSAVCRMTRYLHVVDFRLASRAALNVACAHRAELWPFPLCCISVVARCCVSTTSALLSIEQRLIYCLFLLEVLVCCSFVLVCVTLSRANYSRSHTAFQLKIRTQPGQANKETLNTINQFLLLISFSPLAQTIVALTNNPVIVANIPPQPTTIKAYHFITIVQLLILTPKPQIQVSVLSFQSVLISQQALFQVFVVVVVVNISLAHLVRARARACVCVCVCVCVCACVREGSVSVRKIFMLHC